MFEFVKPEKQCNSISLPITCYVLNVLAILLIWEFVTKKQQKARGKTMEFLPCVWQNLSFGISAADCNGRHPQSGETHTFP